VKILAFAKQQITRGLQQFAADSLFRNAVFLMSSTAIMSVLGFGFWIFVAHLYSPSEIGAASALIAITLLISNLSFFGLNSGLVRFLPTSKNQSRDINAVLITVGAATAIATIAYLIWTGDDFNGSLKIFSASLGGQLAFILLMIAVALNTLTDSIFIANRRAEFHTIVYAVFGLVKLILPLFLISLGSLGIFAAYSAAAVASLALTFVFMRRAAGYRLWSRPNWHFISRSRKYTTNNYVGVILAGLPSQIMPTLIVAHLGSAHAAYFSMAWTMANLLYVIPSAITNSLLAETSHDIAKQARNIRHAVRILTMILVPAVLLSVLVAPYLLQLFGQQYSAGGTAIFQILAVCAFFVAGNSIGNTIMNIEHRTGGIVLTQIVIAGVTLGLAGVLMDVENLGLVGVGLAMLGGIIAGNIVQLILLAGRQPQAGLKHSATEPSTTIVEAFLARYGLANAGVGDDIGGGDRSSTMVVTTKSQKYVLKVYSAQKKNRSEISQEIDFTQFLLHRGVPVFRVLPNTDGGLISDFNDGPDSWVGVLMDFEPGIHPQHYSAELLGNMARVQGRIHLGGLEYAQRYHHDPDFLKDGAIRSALLSFLPKGLSHFDYESGNMLTQDNQVSCVIDFEGMRYDPLAVCLFFTLTRLYDAMRDTANIGLYLKSYQAVRPLSIAEKAFLRIALGLRYRSPKFLTLRF
jgi:Ser/Thr protein kinase RdoA (MazF antagonist)/O-antigen/teichoic acid export membrane protein